MEITKTTKYLFPSLYLGYDKEFKKFLANLVKDQDDPVRVSSYVGDYNYRKHTKRCIFLLLKVKDDFINVLNTFKEHESYIDDYPVGEFDSSYHMVICQLNNQRAYNYFMVSKYSEMYDTDFLQANFRIGIDKNKENVYISTYHVLEKTEKRRLEIIEELVLEDSKNHAISNYYPDEYEHTLDMNEEIFDYNKMMK